MCSYVYHIYMYIHNILTLYIYVNTHYQFRWIIQSLLLHQRIQNLIQTKMKKTKLILICINLISYNNYLVHIIYDAYMEISGCNNPVRCF